jgi:hypothetical protein
MTGLESRINAKAGCEREPFERLDIGIYIGEDLILDIFAPCHINARQRVPVFSFQEI